MIDVRNRYRLFLREYNGDAAPFASVDPMLSGLAAQSTGRTSAGLARGQKRILAGAGALLVPCRAASLSGRLAAGSRVWTVTPQLPSFIIIVAPTASPAARPRRQQLQPARRQQPPPPRRHPRPRPPVADPDAHSDTNGYPRRSGGQRTLERAQRPWS